MKSQKLDVKFTKSVVCEHVSSAVENLLIADNNVSASAKVCGACCEFKPLSDYPKKGAGRYEDKCKPCHNEFIKQRRQSRKLVSPNEWSIESIPCAIKFTENGQNAFVGVLYQLLKSESIENNPEEIPTIDSLINSTSSLEELIKKKRNST